MTDVDRMTDADEFEALEDKARELFDEAWMPEILSSYQGTFSSTYLTLYLTHKLMPVVREIGAELGAGVDALDRQRRGMLAQVIGHLLAQELAHRNDGMT